MSLLKPTPGEVLDRLSIVRLKIAAYTRAGKDSKALEQEAIDLAEYIGEHGTPHEFSHLFEGLIQNNKRLWELEDQVRRVEITKEELCYAAKGICLLNDDRNRLIREMDKVFGVKPQEEKIYSK